MVPFVSEILTWTLHEDFRSGAYVGEADWIESLIYMLDREFDVATMIFNSIIPNRAKVCEFDIVYVLSDA